eukprot:TRINITY_DN10839_c0_g10_i1.p1 TRINITY_DN10839_c0_g10~~TRINITY_DN10839_c0_g10_i1.p1  ORF type:complete len:187 (-),score=28.59 TRINITY_DN10839_c0_g10_i1:65-625(-)
MSVVSLGSATSSQGGRIDQSSTRPAGARSDGQKERSLRLVNQVGSCGRALAELLTTLPTTPRGPGGEDEAVMIRSHLAACGKLREAKFAISELRKEQCAVTPSDKIYVDPTVVPTLLSTRLPPAVWQTAPSQSSASADQKFGPSDDQKFGLQLMAHKKLCDKLSEKVRKNMADMLAERPTKKLRSQ